MESGTSSPTKAREKRMSKRFWQFRNRAGSHHAELLLYGDIAQTSWWGDEVTPRQFSEELAGLGAVDEITVCINSGGGDVFAAQAIGNMLEQNAAMVTARIDGLCASAATIVACHCDKVVAANDAIYMVHPVKMGICDYMDAGDLQKCIEALAAIRESITGLYARKTGRPQDEVAALMDAENWWTSAQAKEEGFVDELVDEETVVENRSGFLFVNSVAAGVPFDKAPEFVRDRLKAKAQDGQQYTRPAGKPENTKGEETGMDIKNANDLRAAYPDLVNEVETAAAAAERERIRAIEDMALPGDETAVTEAKFQKPISASEYAMSAVKRAKAQGVAYLKNVAKDADLSGANNVGQAATGNGKEKSAEDMAGSSFIDAIRKAGGKKEKED